MNGQEFSVLCLQIFHFGYGKKPNGKSQESMELVYEVNNAIDYMQKRHDS